MALGERIVKKAPAKRHARSEANLAGEDVLGM
jgi:hypothetical protein